MIKSLWSFSDRQSLRFVLTKQHVASLSPSLPKEAPKNQPTKKIKKHLRQKCEVKGTDASLTGDFRGLFSASSFQPLLLGGPSSGENLPAIWTEFWSRNPSSSNPWQAGLVYLCTMYGYNNKHWPKSESITRWKRHTSYAIRKISL